VQVSALTGEGLPALGARLAEAARARLTTFEATIPFALTGLVATVYAEGSEVRQEPTDEGTHVRALMPPAAAARITAALNGAG
jgi:50S ribosomal subunit-associated GTPase HflX